MISFSARYLVDAHFDSGTLADGKPRARGKDHWHTPSRYQMLRLKPLGQKVEELQWL